MMTTRRTILTAIGLSPLAAAPAVAHVSPEERLDRAMQEMLDAAEALEPGEWATFRRPGYFVVSRRLDA